jgi:hypothetical protein
VCLGSNVRLYNGVLESTLDLAGTGRRRALLSIGCGEKNHLIPPPVKHKIFIFPFRPSDSMRCGGVFHQRPLWKEKKGSQYRPSSGWKQKTFCKPCTSPSSAGGIQAEDFYFSFFYFSAGQTACCCDFPPFQAEAVRRRVRASWQTRRRPAGMK